MKRYSSSIYGLVSLFVFFTELNGQGKLELENILSQYEFKNPSSEIFYKDEWVEGIIIDNESNSDIIDLTLIKSILKKNGLELYVYKDQFFFIYPNQFEFEKMRLREQSSKVNVDFEEYLNLGDPSQTIESKKYTLNGLITDNDDNPLPGVIISSEHEWSQTNEKGEYRLLLNTGNYVIKYDYVGSEQEIRYITVYGSGRIDITMFPEIKLLDEIVVEYQDNEFSSNESIIGVSRITASTLETIPAFLGEVDPLKSVVTLPGVTASGETSSFVNVRGGRNDQTLILMNGAPIFSPGHLLGFFSVFNGDFVSDFSLYKGMIPSNYGTRAPSVLDVSLNKRATKKTDIYGGIGIANSNFGVKSKLLDGQLDFHIGGRASYADWLFNTVPNKSLANSTASFYDFNLVGKYVDKPKNNSISISSFYSSDYFKYTDDIIYQWEAYNSVIEWTHVFKNDWLFSSQALISRLDNQAEGLIFNDEFLLDNGIETISFKNSLSTDFHKIEAIAGLDVSYYSINPGVIEPNSSNSLVQSKALDHENLLDLGFYLDLNYQVTEKLSVNPGVRCISFKNMGPGTVPIYQQGVPLSQETVIGQETFEPGNSIASYNVVEPRIGVNLDLGSSSLKFGFTRTNQFLHLISNTVTINPISVWKGVDRYISPTLIDQISVGYEKRFFKGLVSVSVEGYAKKMSNLVDYKDGADLILNEHIEQEILRGTGESYGTEFQISKTSGLFSGWLSYTYSRAFITTKGDYPEETINNGDRYPYYADRPHNIQLNLKQKLNKKWTLSSNFTYTSGAPTSAPTDIYRVEGITIPYFSERNSERIPDYHRLDLALTLKSRIRKTQKNKDRWVLTIYNVYSRKNVTAVFFAKRDDIPAQSFQLISIGQIIPTITYKFQF